MKFDQYFIERVRDATNIIDIIGPHTNLTRSGGGYKGLCPFPDHREKTPSFNVNEVKQLYHCFGCKRGGTVFKFLEEMQGLTFPEAVEFLAARASISLPEKPKYNNSPSSSGDSRKLLLRLNKFAASFYLKQLRSPNGEAAMKYLLARGLTSETIDEFKLGVALEEWSGLANYLKSKGAPLKDAEKLGLIKKRNQAEGHFDLLRNRVIFPILSPIGNVVGFGGRSLTDEQQPKYLNSPESEVFSKGRTLYGLHLSAKHIRSADEAYVVEGYMDMIALYQAGIKNVVATLGTALTADHARILKRYTSRVVALFDGDAAGELAAERSLPIFLNGGLMSRVLRLPDQFDPDEFITEKGVEAFKSLAAQAPEHFLYFLKTLLSEFHGQNFEKLRVLEKVAPVLAGMADQTLQSLYVREISDRLSVPENLVRDGFKASGTSRMNKTNDISSLSVPTGQQKAAPENKKWPNEERILIKLVLKNRAFAEKFAETRIWELMESPDASKMGQEISEICCKKFNDFDRVGTYLVELGFDSILISEALTEGTNSEAEEIQLFEDCLKKVKSRYQKREARKLISFLKEDDHADRLEHFMNVVRDSETKQ